MLLHCCTTYAMPAKAPSLMMKPLARGSCTEIRKDVGECCWMWLMKVDEDKMVDR
jgi:hypothetical protein